MSNLSGTC